MNKVIIYLVLIFALTPAVYAKTFQEAYYQNIWCSQNRGIKEYKLNDETRVDCLTSEYACEFDFAHKWYEGFTQALWYAHNTGKMPCLVLIIEKPTDFVYYERARVLSNKYGVRLWFMQSPLYLSSRITLRRY
ncbi:MAG: hypothetical protein WCG95_08920 [bacterium]